MHILLIEDHSTVAKNIESFLKKHGYTVTVAQDGAMGLELALILDIDVLVLDINVPTIDGITICKTLRERHKQFPILMVTARNQRADIVLGLDIGADDYLSKPFDLDELLARIRALMRRHSVQKTPVIEICNIQINTNTQQVYKDGSNIVLSPKEYALLLFLVQHQGIAQDRMSILSHVWGSGDAVMMSNTVDVHIAFLRKKLGKDIIHTVPNTGYIIPDAHI